MTPPIARCYLARAAELHAVRRPSRATWADPNIVEGGNVPPKAVAIANGTCPKPGASVAKLPPFKGNQYQAFVHHAQLATFMGGKHALVIYGSGSAIYACGTLNRPNALVP